MLCNLKMLNTVNMYNNYNRSPILCHFVVNIWLNEGQKLILRSCCWKKSSFLDLCTFCSNEKEYCCVNLQYKSTQFDDHISSLLNTIAVCSNCKYGAKSQHFALIKVKIFDYQKCLHLLQPHPACSDHKGAVLLSADAAAEISCSLMISVLLKCWVMAQNGL